MTSSTGACGRDVDQHLASADHELHSTSIPFDVGGNELDTTSGLAAHGTTDDMSVSERAGQSFPRRDHDSNGRTTERMVADMSSADSQDVTDGLVAASTLLDDVIHSQDVDDDTSHQCSAGFSSSSDTLASSCTDASPSYMRLRSKTSR